MKNLLLLVRLASAFSFSGELTASDQSPYRLEDFRKDVLITATLANDRSVSFSSFVLENGRFSFVDLPEGEYSLSVVNNRFLYPTIMVDSKSRQAAIIQASDDVEPFSLDKLVFEPLGKMEFFPPKQPFDVFQSLKSPMFMFTAGVIGLMAVLTKLQSSLGDDQDPNVAGRLAEMQVMIEKTMMPFEKQSVD